MNEIMQNYIKVFDDGLARARQAIETEKEIFRSTDWTDMESMVKSAGKIWAHESQIKDAMEQHELILSMMKEA